MANEDKISKLVNQLGDMEESLTTAQNGTTQPEKLLKNAEIIIGEGIMQMEKERESASVERSQILREKSEECALALKQLEKSKEKVTRLRDVIVHLENVSSSKDQEKIKLKKTYETFNGKAQKREEELLKACKDFEEERSLLLEKTRACQATMEALKHQCKVNQQDCKKACELADLKSQECRDLEDKLDDSQKHLQEARQQLSRAEMELKQSKDELKEVKLEKTELLEKMNEKKDELEATIEELWNEISTREETISKLSSQLESSSAVVRATENKKLELEEMLAHAKEERNSVVEKLNAVATEKVEREAMVKSNEEDEMVISVLKEEVQSLEASNSEIKSALENAEDEYSQLKNTVSCMEDQHASAMALKDSEYEQKVDAMRQLETITEQKMDKLQKEVGPSHTFVNCHKHKPLLNKHSVVVSVTETLQKQIFPLTRHSLIYCPSRSQPLRSSPSENVHDLS